MLFSRRELRFSRSFLSNIKKSGLNIALPFFVCTSIPACYANPTGTIPVIVTSSSPSASPVNSVGTGTTIVIGGVNSNTGSPTPSPSIFETGGFGLITGNVTNVSKSAGYPWDPSNSIPISSPSPVNGTWQEGSLPKKVDATSGNESTNSGFGSQTGSQKSSIGGSTIGAGAITDCSSATSTVTSSAQQIDVKLTPCPKATSAGNPW